MNFSYNKRISKTHQNISEVLSSSQDSFDQNQKSIQKTNLNKEWLHELYSSKQRFHKFVSQIQQAKDKHLRQDVLAHFQNNSLSEKIYEVNHSTQTVLKLLNGRIQKMIKNKRIKKNWSQQDIQILTWLISKFADKHNYNDISKDLTHEDWKFISSLIPGVSAKSCMFKWLSLKKVNLATYNWSVQQSFLLSQIVKKQQHQSNNNSQIKDWKTISQKLYTQNLNEYKIFRNAKQCRQHWNCYLNPKLKKGPWSSQQDVKLLKKILQNKGSKKWSQIVKNFNGRTQNALKNRYTLIIQKQKKIHKGKNQLELIEEYLQKCYVEQFTSVIKTQNQDQNKLGDQQNFIKKENEVKMQSQIYKKQTQIQLNQSNSLVTNPSPVISNPLKIQKFKIQNFANLSKSFFKFIQPGIINSDGSFRQLKDSFLVKNTQS